MNLTLRACKKKTQTAFTRCRHILKTVKNVTDRPPVHTKAHFCRQISKTVDSENGSLNRHILEAASYRTFFETFWNETDRLLGSSYIS